MEIKDKLKQFPESPGVYLMKNGEDGIIYIGKAVNLKRRVSSYFRRQDNPKTAVLVSRIDDIEYIATDSEIEALILECNLIKKHRPRFNIRLKDDKRFPYIAVTMGEAYPRLILTRKTSIRSARYFGPYTDAAAARSIADTINVIFKLRTCRKELPLKSGGRPCLNFQMNRCCGACTSNISEEEYGELVSGALHFLEGDIEPVLADMNRAMKRYSESMHYEHAARIRDIIADIHRLSQEQKVSISMGQDMDYLHAEIIGREAVLLLFEFRKGVLLGRKIHLFDNADLSEPGDIVRSFIIDYYSRSEIPSRIISPFSIKDKRLTEEFLTQRASRRISITGPVSGEDQGIIAMIKKNMDMIIADREAAKYYQDRSRAAEELMELLGLERAPSEIVCFDISNLQGTNPVASMVTFRDGEPDKSSYRRFRIKAHEGPDDPAMIHEAVSRRLQLLVNENLPFPDIMVIDGGPTQLTRAMEAAANFPIKLKIISLAKRFEEIYVSPKEPPIRLPETSPARKLLQRVRDESHRFAITYHRKLRSGEFTSSRLDQIPRISRELRTELLKHFNSIEAVMQAGPDELMQVKGIGEKTANAIHGFFHGPDACGKPDDGAKTT